MNSTLKPTPNPNPNPNLIVISVTSVTEAAATGGLTLTTKP
jgi:hypothetical protein